MSIEDIIRAWKSGEEYEESTLPESPVGPELSDEDLKGVVGGMNCSVSCEITCVAWTSCGNVTVAWP